MQEGKIVASTIARLAKKDGFDNGTIHRLQDLLIPLEQNLEGLGFCLSEDGDLLSQWRGYAHNATGVAIGFSTEYLKQLSTRSLGRDEPGFTLQQVVYEPSIQESVIEHRYLEIKSCIDSGAFKTPPYRTILGIATDTEIEQETETINKEFGRLSLNVIPLFSELYRLKGRTFREEREWRLLSYFVRCCSDSCLYRTVNDCIAPYRQVALVDLNCLPIKEVVLGPKHKTPLKVVEDFLKQNQYGGAQVKRSEASYR